MVKEQTEWVYFKKNVGFSVGVRFHLRDNEGMVLTDVNPYVNVDKDKLRDFLQANKYGIQNGLIVQSEEPTFDWMTENTITDEQVTEMVKNVFILKKRLPEITSEAALFKIYNEAKSQNRSKKIIELIEDRLAEISPALMQGSDMGTNHDEVGV